MMSLVDLFTVESGATDTLFMLERNEQTCIRLDPTKSIWRSRTAFMSISKRMDLLAVQVPRLVMAMSLRPLTLQNAV
jgi:hypothetical protein